MLRDREHIVSLGVKLSIVPTFHKTHARASSGARESRLRFIAAAE